MTTDHLPECETYRKEIGYVCICGLLHACEERVWDEAYACGFNAGRAHGEKVGTPPLPPTTGRAHKY